MVSVDQEIPFIAKRLALALTASPLRRKRNTPTVQAILPLNGGLEITSLTPTNLETGLVSYVNLRPTPQFARSAITDSAYTLEKLQKKIIQQRIQQEITAREKTNENLASWMSSIADCTGCQDTTVPPDPEDKNSILTHDRAGVETGVQARKRYKRMVLAASPLRKLFCRCPTLVSKRALP
jgi:hypothetical protein